MRIYILAFSILFLTSCASLDLFNKESEVTNINTTVGEELIDLKKALDAGAITEDEYNEMKKKILDRDSE